MTISFVRRYYVWIIGILFLFPFLLYAQSSSGNTITVEQEISVVDVLPPTTPAFITATPVASTQIDLAWGSSTDNYSFRGYRLFRGGVQIATTSLISYSDTGLTPSTTYAYTVEAYDWALNTSTSTGPVATSTLPVVVVSSTSTEETTGGMLLNPRVVRFAIDTTTRSAVFSWDTNIYTRYMLRWGLSSSYELGFVQSDAYKRSHVTRIDGLQPETTYQYELVGFNQRDNQFVLKEGSFKTKALPDVTAPANVSNLQAVVEGTSVYLSWENPEDPDFAKVRVVRNHFFYPQSTTDGFIVYEGTLTSLIDADVLGVYDQQYYTVFTYDAFGNISSGAVVLALRGGSVVPRDTALESGSDSSGEGGSGIDTSGATTSSEESASAALSFWDVIFMQDGFELAHGDGNVTVRDDLPLTIQIPADLLPTYLKAITVTLRDGKNVPQSYILQPNSARTMYEARISTLPEGTYGALFAIYNFARSTETIFSGEVLSTPHSNVFLEEIDPVWLNVIQNNTFALYGTVFGLGSLLFLIWWYLFMFKRSTEDN